MTATITPLEALRRLIAEVKQLDAVEVGARWNQLQGELGVAEGVVRDWNPAIHCEEFHTLAMDYRGASLLSGLGHAQEAYEAMCAYINKRIAPASTQPVPEGWRERLLQEKSVQEKHYSEVAAAASAGSRMHMGERDCTEGVILGVQYCINALDELPAAPTAAVSAAPSGELLTAAERMRKAHVAAKIPAKLPAYAEAHEYQAAVQDLIAAAITATKE